MNSAAENANFLSAYSTIMGSLKILSSINGKMNLLPQVVLISSVYRGHNYESCFSQMFSSLGLRSGAGNIA